jgi:hypothetical protein
MKKRLNLIVLSLYWSAFLALVMTLIGFLHNTPTSLTAPDGGGIVWSRVLFLYFGWFVFAEIVILIGGLGYAVSSWLRQGSNR